MKQVAPYTKLAQIYDRLMDHVNYREWSRYIQQLFQFAESPVVDILDVSCGTGSLLTYIGKQRFTCFGSDSSLEMLLQANKKSALKNCSLVSADAANLPLREDSFDAVLFLYDSINYLQQPGDVLATLKEIGRVLRRGGVLIFDVVTPYQCREYYFDYYENEFWGQSGYHRHSYYREDEGRQNNDFQIFIGEEIYEEKHSQRIYTRMELDKLIAGSGLEQIAAFDNFTLMHANENSERIHFVCRKSKDFK